MNCRKCNAPNPEGKRFCGDCGASLDAMDEDFRLRVQGLLREHLKDQKLVEIEITDEVMARLKTWGKPFLYMFAMFIAVLGGLGYRSMRDIVRAMESAQVDAVQKLREQATAESKSLAKEAETIRAQYRKLGDQQDLVSQLRQTEDQLKAIQSASRNLKARYEQLGTDLATAQTSIPTERASVRVPSEAGIRGGGASPPTLTASALPAVYAPGSSGPEVQRIQSRLHELGCYSGAISGAFDQATKLAVSRFNEARGDILGVGVVDSPTASALFGNRAPRCR